MREKLIGYCVLVLHLLLAFFLNIANSESFAAGRCSPLVAKTISVQGQVEVSFTGQARWQQVGRQEGICAGDRVRVGAWSRATLKLPSQKTLITLDARTTITFSKVETNKPSWLELIEGAVHFISRVPNTLNIKTPFVTAGVEGTEFVLRVGQTETELWVLAGQVSFNNSAGNLNLKSGEAAVAQAGKAPVRRLIVRPREAVQWALYYPPIIDYRSGIYGKGIEARLLIEAIENYRHGKLPAAFAQLNNVPSDLRDVNYFVLRAGMLLTVGKVSEALADIERGLRQDPANGTAYALQSIIEVVQNQEQNALRLAQKAEQLDPESPVPQVALSYAYQAVFDVEKAFESIKKAIEFDPNDALAWARIAELELSRGYLVNALEYAQRAVELDREMAKPHTVLGFAYLVQTKISQAKTAFERAIDLEPTDPLPYLGLGLVKIRSSNLDEGAEEIEIAASLDPNNALVRSYLGKAYFQQRRNTLAATEFDISKALDPKDPTPWLYDAILKQSDNRPVEALHNLQKSIELNDNRAVYRSRLLLDQDLAIRSASLGTIFTNLGFNRLGLVESSKSLSFEPTSYSAHRVLADAYTRVPRHGVARVSELFQSQLLQPININPIQPQLAATDFNVVTNTSFNEFTPLFESERPQLRVSGVLGNNDTWAEEVVLSGLYRRLSYSLSQLHFNTDGFRQNNDIEQDVYDAFAQFAITPRLNLQAEISRRESEQGDFLNIQEEDSNTDIRGELEQNTGRLGFHYTPSPRSDIVTSLIYSDLDERITPFDKIEFETEKKGYQAEAQYFHRADFFNVTAGVGFSDIDVRQKFSFFSVFEGTEDFTINQHNAYLYANLFFPRNLIWTLGLSYDKFEERVLDLDELNPKLGLQWDIADKIRLRLAWFETVKRSLLTDRTIEPTQVAGFNQVFDDIDGTQATRYGIGLDAGLDTNLYAGVEASHRDLEVPKDSFGEVEIDNQKEVLYRSYIYWTPHNDWALSAEYRLEKLKRDSKLFSNRPTKIETMSIPLAARYFSASGFFAGLGLTYVDQEVDSSTISNFTSTSDSDNFFVLDASLGYRLPKRRGIISLEAMNLLDEGFRFQAENLQPRFFANEQVQLSRPTDTRFIPERTLLFRFTLNF